MFANFLLYSVSVCDIKKLWKWVRQISIIAERDEIWMKRMNLYDYQGTRNKRILNGAVIFSHLYKCAYGDFNNAH